MSRNARPESAPSWSRSALGALPWVAPLALLPSFLWSLREAASWPIVHDVPLMLYAGFLMQEHDLVPYRDFFEMNPPGTLAFNAVYYDLVGSSAGAFRVAHLGWLAAVLPLSSVQARPRTVGSIRAPLLQRIMSHLSRGEFTWGLLAEVQT